MWYARRRTQLHSLNCPMNLLVVMESYYLYEPVKYSLNLESVNTARDVRYSYTRPLHFTLAFALAQNNRMHVAWGCKLYLHDWLTAKRLVSLIIAHSWNLCLLCNPYANMVLAVDICLSVCSSVRRELWQKQIRNYCRHTDTIWKTNRFSFPTLTKIGEESPIKFRLQSASIP